MTDIVEALRQGAALAGADGEFVAATRGLDSPIHLRVEAAAAAARGAPGQAAGEPIVAWAGAAGAPPIVLQAGEPTWRRIASAAPPPGHHSFTAARRLPEGFAVHGEPLAVAQALHALERLFEILRRPGDAGAPCGGGIDGGPAGRDAADAGAGGASASGTVAVAVAATPPPAAALPDLSAISGAYFRLDVDGEPLNVYAETCGPADAPALLMLHTAGADSRQYHGLMADPRLRASWRMMAFDMPGHGRSMPAAGAAWQGRALTRERYLAVCAAFARQVARRPVVLLGCSMGAAMALYMAARHPGDVAGVVALEAPWRATGRLTPYLAHPAVNATAHNPAYVRGLMGPAASQQARRDAAWIYSQGGFRTYADDLQFYSEDFDAEVHLRGLRADRFGISLLTGAYDYSASPEDSRRVAAMIPGARFAVMPELGHFPMVEDPARLMDYLGPELERIRAGGTAAS